jgi:hypothetical protein
MSPRACQACQRSKVYRHTATPLRDFTPPAARFHHIHVDLIGPLPMSAGFTYCLTAVDRFPIPRGGRGYVGTFHRLPKSVSKQQLDKQDYRGNLWEYPMEGSHNMLVVTSFFQNCLTVCDIQPMIFNVVCLVRPPC